MVEINRELCIGCGACVRDCPGGALEVADKKAQYIRKCIQCGHCVAVCPTGAVSIPEYAMDEVEEYDQDSFRVDPEHLLRAIKFRRSIRNFKSTPVETEKLERILNAGRYAPTAKNTQGSRFVLIRDELEAFKELFWQELPGLLEEMKEEAPLYERVFRGFYEKHEKDPKEDTFFFNATSFLVITRDLVSWTAGSRPQISRPWQRLRERAPLFSGYTKAVVERSDALREWLGIGRRSVTCCMLLGYRQSPTGGLPPRKAGNIVIR